MKNVTKQGRKRRNDPHVNSRGKVTGKVGWGQSNKLISTLRRLGRTVVDEKKMDDLSGEYNQQLELTLGSNDGSTQKIVVGRIGEFKIDVIKCDKNREEFWSKVDVTTKFVHLVPCQYVYDKMPLEVEFEGPTGKAVTTFRIIKIETHKS
jgi:hypothetical protein